MRKCHKFPWPEDAITEATGGTPSLCTTANLSQGETMGKCHKFQWPEGAIAEAERVKP